MPTMPPGIATVTLTGRYIRPDGTPLVGTVTFATPALLTLSGADTISAGTATATLTTAGTFSIVLVATDNAAMQPASWAYQVTERFQDVTGRTYAISLPSTTPTVDLADIAPADPSQGQYVLVPGPTGPTGGTGPTGPAGPPGEMEDHAATHRAGGGDAVQLTQAQVDGLNEALALLAPLAGATFSGVLTVQGANLLVMGTGKGYRLRPLGDRLDLEATGSDLEISVFQGTSFDGAQRAYLRLESGVQLAHAIGRWQFCAGPDAAAVHVLDGTDETIGLYGANPVGQQTITGSRTDGTALTNLLTKLALTGLVVDATTA